MSTHKRRAPKDVEHLKAKGKSGIIKNFNTQATAGRNKKLQKTSEDNERVKSLIKEFDAIKIQIRSQRLLNRSSLERKYLRLLYLQIKRAVIRQGFISNSTLARFKFSPADLVEKITYRNLIENFVTNNFLGTQAGIIQSAIVEEAKKGKYIDTLTLSDEFYELYGELKWLDGSGELTPDEISAGWLKLMEIKNADKTQIYKEQAEIENLCFFITLNPPNPAFSLINGNNLRSLSTTNLERLISFYCKIFNANNKKAILAKRKADKRLKTNSKYVPKKPRSAKETSDLVKDLKSKGKTQKEVAKQLGCSERTVRNYWK